MAVRGAGIGAEFARVRGVEGVAVARRQERARRTFDLVVTALLLPFALVVGAALAVAVAIDSHGPVLYRSVRIGRAGRPFTMLKFRTMRHGVGGPSLTAHGDERQTPFGRFLARARLDELPQLWNVVRGDMRLVGPRPELAQFVADQHDSYELILSVPPGLTGPTQLAFAGEGALLAAAHDRATVYRDEILPEKVRLDLEYVASSSLRGDLAVIARTCLVPFTRRGRRHGGEGLARVAVTVAAVAPVALFVAVAGGAPW